MRIEIFWAIIFFCYIFVLFWRSKPACITMLFVIVTTYGFGWSEIFVKCAVAFTYLWAMFFPDLHKPESVYSEKWRRYYKEEYEKKLKKLTSKSDDDNRNK